MCTLEERRGWTQEKSRHKISKCYRMSNVFWYLQNYSLSRIGYNIKMSLTKLLSHLSILLVKNGSKTFSQVTYRKRNSGNCSSRRGIHLYRHMKFNYTLLFFLCWIINAHIFPFFHLEYTYITKQNGSC